MKLTLSHVFDTPGPHPNGLQATTEGLWILDQGDNRISLHDYRDGATRESSTVTPTGAAGSPTAASTSGCRPPTVARP